MCCFDRTTSISSSILESSVESYQDYIWIMLMLYVIFSYIWSDFFFGVDTQHILLANIVLMFLYACAVANICIYLIVTTECKTQTNSILYISIWLCFKALLTEYVVKCLCIYCYVLSLMYSKLLSLVGNILMPCKLTH